MTPKTMLPPRLDPRVMERLDLDTQIAIAELAVIERDARIRHRGRLVVRRVKRGVVRHAGSGLAVAVGTGLVTWWLNRRHAGSPPAPPAAPAPPSAGENIAREAGLSLAGLLPLVWPYLPQDWRRTVSPRMASTLLSLVTPLFARIFRRRPKASEAA